jgi:hypothetical protein
MHRLWLAWYWTPEDHGQDPVIDLLCAETCKYLRNLGKWKSQHQPLCQYSYPYRGVFSRWNINFLQEKSKRRPHKLQLSSAQLSSAVHSKVLSYVSSDLRSFSGCGIHCPSLHWLANELFLALQWHLLLWIIFGQCCWILKVLRSRLTLWYYLNLNLWLTLFYMLVRFSLGTHTVSPTSSRNFYVVLKSLGRFAVI